MGWGRGQVRYIIFTDTGSKKTGKNKVAGSGNLIIIDYSGTLSLEMVRFGCSDTLMKHLEETGLCGLGVSSVEIFWNSIVNPSWEEGSTTGKGYQKLLLERISRLYRSFRSSPDPGRLESAVKDFCSRYFSGSVIDPAWTGLFRFLGDMAETITVIATDHYAEATDSIIRHLGKLEIPAASVCSPDAGKGNTEKPVFVANSADIGALKSSSVFWKSVLGRLGMEKAGRIILIDDFGHNEQKNDPYGAAEKIKRRSRGTAEMLQSFSRDLVNAFPFFIDLDICSEKDTFLYPAYRNLVRHASGFVFNLLS